jgi:two-component system LytT family sensor kinase
MKENKLPFSQIEYWVVTLVFLAIILSNILSGNPFNFQSSDDYMAEYFAKLFIPAILFLSFYLVHMKLIPGYFKEKKRWKYGSLLLLVVLLSFALTGAFSVGAGFTQDFFMPYYFNTLAIYTGYMIFVYVLEQILAPPRLENIKPYNIVRLLAIYLFVFLFLLQFQRLGSEPIAIFFAVIIPGLILVFFYNFFLVYKNKKAGNQSTANLYLILLGVSIMLIFFVFGFSYHIPQLFFVGLAVTVLVITVLIPISNLFFEKYDFFQSEIQQLTSTVDQSQANLDFLRSQINPHFLFNVLNTLYGSALQEKADKTAESIQKLGDMMRFMLHENHQESIPLTHEKEYLINYVSLQELRLDDHENIDIQFNRSESPCSGQIAPMLLIPFVENAFKHGISLQKKSWIKISLRCLEGSVHLDVNNSIHRSADEDPEKKSSGIGLENVKQRLQLLYPEKHELMIRENDEEYFVHLSIKL